MATLTIKPKKRSKGLQMKVKNLADVVAKVEKTTTRTDHPDFGPGDTVRVHVRIKEGDKERIQPYEGLVVGRSNTAAGKTFVVRKMSHGFGVERIFMESSPKVAKVELVQEGKVRRAKLYYIRALEGKAAKIERDVETLAAAAASAAAKDSTKAPAKK